MTLNSNDRYNGTYTYTHAKPIKYLEMTRGGRDDEIACCILPGYGYMAKASKVAYGLYLATRSSQFTECATGFSDITWLLGTISLSNDFKTVTITYSSRYYTDSSNMFILA